MRGERRQLSRVRAIHPVREHGVHLREHCRVGEKLRRHRGREAHHFGVSHKVIVAHRRCGRRRVGARNRRIVVGPYNRISRVVLKRWPVSLCHGRAQFAEPLERVAELHVSAQPCRGAVRRAHDCGPRVGRRTPGISQFQSSRRAQQQRARALPAIKRLGGGGGEGAVESIDCVAEPGGGVRCQRRRRNGAVRRGGAPVRDELRSTLKQRSRRGGGRGGGDGSNGGRSRAPHAPHAARPLVEPSARERQSASLLF
ncbi:hypothetical protein T492DRAFT_1065042 [Pavlovales sp. CCMP2436]|nr:hypothetical protein T492DRAFT_1065042 [Pavlovales sp. CCMP2436]|mmetsp:Transcript_374/g.991  ORF Transcript_374/g.991 Transcript_374/m.991 type:complete len:255 (-) Transcript_374:69-833(-)